MITFFDTSIWNSKWKKMTNFSGNWYLSHYNSNYICARFLTPHISQAYVFPNRCLCTDSPPWGHNLQIFSSSALAVFLNVPFNVEKECLFCFLVRETVLHFLWPFFLLQFCLNPSTGKRIVGWWHTHIIVCVLIFCCLCTEFSFSFLLFCTRCPLDFLVFVWLLWILVFSLLVLVSSTPS